MSTLLRFLGHSTPEGPPTILYQHNNDHYMFNCREGTQRLAVEDKVKLSKLKGIFFSRLQWECAGGVPGMLLTLADTGIQNLDLYGGKNLTHFMAATRNFVYRTSMTVKTHEFAHDIQTDSVHQYINDFKSNSLTVMPVVVLPSERKGTCSGVKRRRSQSPSSSSSNSDYEPSDCQQHASKNRVTSMSPHQHRSRVVSLMFSNQKSAHNSGKDNKNGDHLIDAPCTPRHPLANPATAVQEATVELKQQDEQAQAIVTPFQQSAEAVLYDSSLPKTEPYQAAISFICQTPEIRGKFLNEEARRLGVPPGPLFGKLQRGEPVTLENGTVVTKAQVCEDNVPGSIFMIIDCPDTRYIDGLVSSPKFTPYQSLTDTKNIPKVIIHMASAKVLANQKYQQWMNKFNSETEHIVSNEDLCPQTTLYRSHALSQYKLSKLNDDIFQIPKYNNLPDLSLNSFSGLPSNVSVLKNKTTYTLSITRKSDLRGQHLDTTPPFDILQPENDEKMMKFNEDLDLQQIIREAKQKAYQVELDPPFAGDDVQVVTLGTGSSLPSKYRNVSATLIKVPGFGSILLDAGEGTYGQMLRHFGRDRIQHELRSLRCIFVSHLHADHHLGVFQLLIKRKQAKNSNRSLFVIGPFAYQRWMLEYNGIEHLGSPKNIRFIRSNHIVCHREQTANRSTKALEHLKQTLGLSNIETVEVDHCRYAYGLSLEHNTGWKLVYSGDTRPCDRLIEAGQNATLLIHEATLEDGMKEEAIAKKHSTTEEAVEVGQKMKARYTLLNHFSQRYAKVPTLSEAQTNVCISFDMMSVLIKQVPLLPSYTKAMQLIFKEDEEVDDNEMTLNQKEETKKKRKVERKK